MTSLEISYRLQNTCSSSRRISSASKWLTSFHLISDRAIPFSFLVLLNYYYFKIKPIVLNIWLHSFIQSFNICENNYIRSDKYRVFAYQPVICPEWARDLRNKIRARLWSFVILKKALRKHRRGASRTTERVPKVANKTVPKCNTSSRLAKESKAMRCSSLVLT